MRLRFNKFLLLLKTLMGVVVKHVLLHNDNISFNPVRYKNKKQRFTIGFLI